MTRRWTMLSYFAIAGGAALAAVHLWLLDMTTGAAPAVAYGVGALLGGLVVGWRKKSGSAGDVLVAAVVVAGVIAAFNALVPTASLLEVGSSSSSLSGGALLSASIVSFAGALAGWRAAQRVPRNWVSAAWLDGLALLLIAIGVVFTLGLIASALARFGEFGLYPVRFAIVLIAPVAAGAIAQAAFEEWAQPQLRRSTFIFFAWFSVLGVFFIGGSILAYMAAAAALSVLYYCLLGVGAALSSAVGWHSPAVRTEPPRAQVR